jgi:hypothetical protein
MYAPITAEALFGQRTEPLNKWGSLRSQQTGTMERAMPSHGELNPMNSTQCYPFLKNQSVHSWSNSSTHQLMFNT